MRTSTAVVLHGATGLVQAGALMGGPSVGLPWWAQLLIQIGLMFGQGVLAVRNSNTDQNGNPLPPAR